MTAPPEGKALWTPAMMNLRRGRNPYFIGRESILDEIRQAFDASATHGKILALVGMGGAGKTSLALEYAHARKLHYNIIWWVSAENPARAASDLAALAPKLDPALEAETDVQVACRAAVRELERRDGWLLIFDNAQFPEHLAPYIPWGGNGHILITSRNTEWKPMAATVLIPPWSRKESIAFLQKRIAKFKDEAIAEKLAAALGDLPLALEQASACIEQTHVTPADYLRQFEAYWGELLQRGTALRQPNFAAMAWELSFRQIETIDPVAGDLLTLCSFLGPEEIPLRIIRNAAAVLPQPLSGVAAAPMGLSSPLATLRQFSLVETPEKSITLHRVIALQARQRLNDQDRVKWATVAVHLVTQAFPFDSQNHETWAECSVTLPHVLAAAANARDGSAPANLVIDLLDRAGKFLLKISQWALAKETLETALAMVNTTYGERSPRYADIANNLGRARHRLGEFNDAMNLFASAMQIDGVLYGPEDPHMASVANNYGMALAATGKALQAKERFEKALRIYETNFGAEHLKVASVLNNLGFVVAQLGDLPGAHAHLERAVGIAERTCGQWHPNVACIVTNLAGVVNSMGRHDEAGQLYSRALAINLRTFGNEHPTVARDLSKIGLFMLERGDSAGAIQHLDRAFRIAETSLGETHAKTITLLNELGKAYTVAGHADRAAECFLLATQRARTAAPAAAAESHESGAPPTDTGAFADVELEFRDPVE